MKQIHKAHFKVHVEYHFAFSIKSHLIALKKCKGGARVAKTETAFFRNNFLKMTQNSDDPKRRKIVHVDTVHCYLLGHLDRPG